LEKAGEQEKAAKFAKIEALFRAEMCAVRCHCLSILGNAADADDATQAVFVRLLISGTCMDDTEQAPLLAQRTATRVCLNMLRGRSRFESAKEELAMYAATGDGRSDPAITCEILDQVRRMLRHLDRLS